MIASIGMAQNKQRNRARLQFATHLLHGAGGTHASPNLVTSDKVLWNPTDHSQIWPIDPRARVLEPITPFVQWTDMNLGVADWHYEIWTVDSAGADLAKIFSTPGRFAGYDISNASTLPYFNGLYVKLYSEFIVIDLELGNPMIFFWEFY